MATREQVSEVFRERLIEDSKTQMDKAKELWPNLPLNFFYLNFAEDSVDIAIGNITRRVAQNDNIVIPDNVIRHLLDVIGSKTLVSEAITLIFLATFQPV